MIAALIISVALVAFSGIVGFHAGVTHQRRASRGQR